MVPFCNANQPIDDPSLSVALAILPIHKSSPNEKPGTTLTIIRFWEHYLFSSLPAAYSFVIKQWHSDPPYNTANRRYFIDIGVHGTNQLLLTGL